MILGVTIASPEYRDMAVKAVESFQRMTGHNALAYFDNKPKNYGVKLQLNRLVPGQNQTLVFFDADTLWVKPVDLRPFTNRPEFLAVPDVAFRNPSDVDFPVRDCKVHGMDPKKYFNSGVFIFNDSHAPVFDRAREIFKTKTFADFGEQSALNYAVQETECPLRFLPEGFNFLPVSRKGVFDWPSDVYVVHAAGYAKERKEEALRLIRDSLSRNELSLNV
jgi:hypothetical protein